MEDYSNHPWRWEQPRPDRKTRLLNAFRRFGFPAAVLVAAVVVGIVYVQLSNRFTGERGTDARTATRAPRSNPEAVIGAPGDTAAAVLPAPDDSAAPPQDRRVSADTNAAASGAPGETTTEGEPPAPEEVTYAVYRNEAFEYALAYPATVLSPHEEVGDGHGRSFEADDGSAALIVYGEANADRRKMLSQYQAELDDPENRVTYRALYDTWFVVSGYRGEDVFYQKTSLSGPELRTFRIQYDTARKNFYDPIVNVMSHSFPRRALSAEWHPPS